MASILPFPRPSVKKALPVGVAGRVHLAGQAYAIGWRIEAGNPVWRAWAGGTHGPEIADPGLVDLLREIARGPAIAA